MEVMEARVVHKPAFHVIGMAGRFTPTSSKIPELWGRFVPRMGEVAHRRGGHTLGLCVDADTDSVAEVGFTYVAGVEVERLDSVPDEMIALTVPANTYAVMTHRGHVSRLPDMVKHVWGRWLRPRGIVTSRRRTSSSTTPSAGTRSPARARSICTYPSLPTEEDTMSSHLDYYRTQSHWTDPGRWARLLGDSPPEPTTLPRALARLLLHPFIAPLRGVDVPATATDDRDVRSVEAMLDRVHARDPRPLSVERAPEQRLFCVCAGFARLAAAVLRLHGFRRCRAGFAAYFNPGFLEDHWVCEYWDGAAWRLLDAQLDEAAMRAGEPFVGRPARPVRRCADGVGHRALASSTRRGWVSSSGSRRGLVRRRQRHARRRGAQQGGDAPWEVVPGRDAAGPGPEPEWWSSSTGRGAPLRVAGRVARPARAQSASGSSDSRI